MKILIIGGNRFIGLQLAWSLTGRGHEVYVFNRGNQRNSLPEKAEKIIGDRKDAAKLRETFSLTGFDVVIDMCAYNIDDLIPLLKTIPEEIPHFIFCSSMAVYDFPEASFLKCEKGGELKAYGYNKFLCEQHLLENLKATLSILRPTYVYGPGDPSGRISRIFDLISKSENLRLHPSLGKYKTQMIYIEDLCNAIIRITEQTAPASGCYDLAFPEQLDFNELIETAAGIMQKKIKLSYTGSRKDFSFELNSDQVIDVRQTWDTLGCQAAFNLQKGLEKTYAWWKEQNQTTY